jgi:hypothetical protein
MKHLRVDYKSESLRQLESKITRRDDIAAGSFHAPGLILLILTSAAVVGNSSSVG